MRLETKKIIAREFIMLVATVALAIVAFLGTYIYNFYQHNQVDKLNKRILDRTVIADSLAKSYNSKLANQKWFYDKNNEKVDLSDAEYNSPYKLWKRLYDLSVKDSIKAKFENVWTVEIKNLLRELNLESPEKLKTFIDNSRITQTDSSDFSKANIIYSELISIKSTKENQIDKVLDINKQLRFGLWTLIIGLICLFGIRYLYHAIKWSLKTLKQK